MLPEDELQMLTILEENFGLLQANNNYTERMYMLGMLEIPINMKKHNKQLNQLINEIQKWLIWEDD